MRQGRRDREIDEFFRKQKQMSDPIHGGKHIFFAPFTALKDVVGPVYKDSIPPERFLGARHFVQLLWACCDEDDVKTMVCESPDAAAQFTFLVSVLSVERLLCKPPSTPDCHPLAHKPFSILASIALGWMDEIEMKTPGKTTPRRAGDSCRDFA